jgi:type VI secretion system protein ImpA
MLRALRWGELRASGNPASPELMEAPPTQVRQELKRLMLDGQWEQLLDSAENAMALPCGRAWLDLQRHVLRACSELGSYYDPIALAVRSELRALLSDFPELLHAALMDDTPAANAETVAFLADLSPSAETARQSDDVAVHSAFTSDDDAGGEQNGSPPDAYEMAMEAVRSGMIEDAIEILAREIGREDSGRGRFQRKMQLAQVCISSRREGMAYPILQELAREIETRRLEDWESSELVAQPLVLLFHCIDRLKLDAADKQKIYGQICRLDPVQAARLT